MSVLEIHCLGSLQIRLDGRPLVGFKTRKTQALLVYLAYHAGQDFSRQHLQALLWSERASKQAAASLRQALTNLRAILPAQMVQVTSGAISLQAESGLWLDVTALTAEPERYQGVFLQGFDLAGAQGWEEWIYTTRERIHQEVMAQLEAKGHAAAAQGDLTTAAQTFQQMLTLDPWREDLHRALMSVYDLLGKRAAALSQYEKCRRILAEELGVEPTVETTALYQRLRAGDGDQPGIAAPFAVPATPQIGFVGRHEQLNQLKAAWAEARRAQGSLTLIEGEAGMGKSRLAEEALRYAAGQGAAVFRGRCYEFGSSVPYQPMIDVLRSMLLGAGQSEVQPRPPVSALWLAEVARLLPELREIYPDLPAASAEDGDARRRLFEAVTQSLSARRPQRSDATVHNQGDLWQPLVIFLDDLHWIDQATLDLLHYLIRRLAGSAIWFLGAYRHEEVEIAHPLLQLRRALSRDGRVTLVQISPLTPAAIEQGLGAWTWLDATSASQLSAYLSRESEGNPFILSELLNDLVERDLLRWRAAEQCWQLADDWLAPHGRAHVPFPVREVIVDRLARLPRDSQDLLRLAAVMGRAFDLPLLREAARPIAADAPGEAAPMIEAHVEGWLARRLVRADRQSQGRRGQPPLDFTHDMIRSVVYETTDPIRRRSLHERVATALERLYPDHTADLCERLAYHYEEAGLTAAALRYLPLAAAKAVSVYANQEALDIYGRALALLHDDDPQRWPLLLRQVEVLRLVGDYDLAISLCRQLVDETEPLPLRRSATIPAVWQARAANQLSAISLARRDYAQAQRWLARSLQLARAEEEALDDALREQAHATQMQGDLARALGQLDRAQQMFESALSLHRQAADAHGEVACLNGLGRILVDRGYYDAALARFQEVLAVYRPLADGAVPAFRHRHHEAASLRAIGNIRWRQGDNDAARQAFEQSLAICRAIGDRQGEAEGINDLGLVYIAQEDRAQARRCWEESVALFRSLGLEKRAVSALHRLGILDITLGDYASAQRHLEESLAINRADNALPAQALDLGWLGLLYYQRGAYEQARAFLSAALALDAQMDGSEEAIWHMTWMGCVAYETGDLVNAERHLNAALQQAQERGMDRRRHHIYHWLAAIYLARGEGEAACQAAVHAATSIEAGANEYALLGVVHSSGLLDQSDDPAIYFEKALACQESNPFLQGMVLRRYGTYLLGADPKAARRYLQEAHAIFTRIGARGELAKTERALDEQSEV